MTTSSESKLPEVLKAVFTESELDAVFTRLMPALGEVLKCDRCFLYLRDPQRSQGRVTHCWSHKVDADLTGSSWIEEENIAEKDPLMTIAFLTPEAVFVEDIETATPDVVNLEYERESFGHRALIHAPLYFDGLLYGILEPCVFGEPRCWTASDRTVIVQVQEQLSPLVASYIRAIGV